MRRYAGGIAAAAALILAQDQRRGPKAAAPVEPRAIDPRLASLSTLTGLSLRHASLWSSEARQCVVPAQFGSTLAQFSALLRVRPARPCRGLSLAVDNTAETSALAPPLPAVVRILSKREFRSVREQRMSAAAA